ncbi:ROK family protein [Nocardioides gilvus]|uniref:ROK family protein n=1 Tax=Nocardioides gilvus TaxID=1735589 RepID=UPI001EF5DE54|nr:ROK family protein [Nocardioides gilvus]
MSDPVWVGVDIGGTKILAGSVDPHGGVGGTVQRPAGPRDGSVEELESTIVEAALAAAAGAPLVGVGLAAAGFVDAAGERVRFAPHLPWREDDVRRRLAARLQVPVGLANDATCALEAEVAHGAARGRDSALLVTVGTGIGGALMVGGRVVRGSGGMAGEFGHMRFVPGGHPCQCGLQGCWEQYASGGALVREIRRATGTAGSDTLTGPGITDAALAGDPAALNAFGVVGRALGLGLAGLVAAFDPDCIVVGGGVSAAGELLLAPARGALVEGLVGAAWRTVPDVLVAACGPEAGMIGAVVQARRQCG